MTKPPWWIVYWLCIDRRLAASQWRNPSGSALIIQSKKDTEDIRVFVDLRSMNSACVHDPFTTPFSDVVLYQVAGKEAYSFIDGFP